MTGICRSEEILIRLRFENDFYENKHQHTQHDSVSKNLKTDSAECSK